MISSKSTFLCRLIDEEQKSMLTETSFGWKKYYYITDIYMWLDQMIKKHPKVLSNYNYGQSYENRTLRAVKVSHNTVSFTTIKIISKIFNCSLCRENQRFL